MAVVYGVLGWYDSGQGTSRAVTDDGEFVIFCARASDLTLRRLGTTNPEDVASWSFCELHTSETICAAVCDLSVSHRVYFFPKVRSPVVT